MSKRKPVIGITGPVKGGTAAWWLTALAVWMQGGRPVRIHPGKSQKDVTLDGLILGGGADISPERYGELLEENSDVPSTPKGLRVWIIRVFSVLLYPVLFLLRYIFSAQSAGTDETRDELEFALLEKACERGIPVLGICRGAQLINVKFGGTLHQNISGFYTEIPNVHSVWPRKIVSIKQQTLLYNITKSGGAWVNALHYQAVDNLGEELKISARDKADIVQALEHPGYEFMMGIQWHPEYLPQIPMQRAIFRVLVEKAAGGIEGEK